MIRTVTLRKLGDSVGVPLPKELTNRHSLAAGDRVFVIETERGPLITPYDPTFDAAMTAYRRGAKKYRNALRELAK